MRVAITGATGFIGKHLVAELASARVEYVIITRSGEKGRLQFPDAAAIAEWHPPDKALDPRVLEGLDGIIHMAGATVAQRWTPAAKKDIYDSRIQSTRLVVDAIRRTNRKPGVLVSFSAIGYYGARDDTKLDESASSGDDFLANVCRDWEEEAARAAALGVRVVNPRIGVVIGANGGALARMLTPFRLGAGGPIGDGRQWMSWIHVADVVGLVHEALKSPKLAGPVNATAPHPVTNREFSKTLGRVLHRPALIPTPVFALKLMFGEFADILATGQRAVPEKAVGAGYRFRFPELEPALASVV